MMHVTIIAVGLLKKSGLFSVCEEYIKRLAPFVTLRVIELPEEKFRDVISERTIVQKKEAARLLARLPDGVLIALDADGREFTSADFASFLEKQTQHGDHLVFVLGGPLGLAEEIKKKAVVTLSLSRLTFPHQLARVVLLEQLYRAVTIIKGKQYHY